VELQEVQVLVELPEDQALEVQVELLGAGQLVLLLRRVVISGKNSWQMVLLRISWPKKGALKW